MTVESKFTTHKTQTKFTIGDFFLSPIKPLKPIHILWLHKSKCAHFIARTILTWQKTRTERLCPFSNEKRSLLSEKLHSIICFAILSRRKAALVCKLAACQPLIVTHLYIQSQRLATPAFRSVNESKLIVNYKEGKGLTHLSCNLKYR